MYLQLMNFLPKILNCKFICNNGSHLIVAAFCIPTYINIKSVSNL